MGWRKERRRKAGINLAIIPIAAVLFSGCSAIAQTTSERGSHIYEMNCRVCHGQHGEGALGPELTGEKNHKNEAQVVDWIEHPLPPMPKLYPRPLSVHDVHEVAHFVMSL
jgi:mono/diheme cytochrome c family protein